MEQIRPVRRRRWADASAPAPSGQWSMGDRWPLLVSVLADEQTDFLRAVREHLAQPSGTPVAPDASPRLQCAADRLQRASRHAQQIARLASGRVRQFRESVDLCNLVRAVLADLGPHSGAQDPIARLDLAPADAFMDAAAAYTVVECLLTWLRTHGSALVLSTEPGKNGTGAVLSASGQRAPARAVAPETPRHRRLDDGLGLLLLQQAVWANGLTLRILAGTDITARVGFPPLTPEAEVLGRIEQPVPQSGSSLH